MFPQIYSHKKGVLARKALPLFFAFCFVLGSALFSGCAMGGSDSGYLVGTWTSSYNETWVITRTGVTKIPYAGASPSYVGTIENNPDFTAPAGVIIIKYTQRPQYYDYDADWNPSDPFEPPGDYYAVYWKSLTVTSVEFADAWISSDFSHNGAPETETLNEAKTKFTLDNAALYAGSYSTCEKR